MLNALNRPVSQVQTLASSPGVPELMETTWIGGNHYIFLKGVSSGAYGSFVTYDEAGVSTLLAADAFGPVALLVGGGLSGAAVATLGTPDANTKGSWALIFGKAYGLVASGFADNGNLYATATAGTADDQAVAGDLVHNAIGRSAIASGMALIQMWYPFVDNNVDDLDVS